jgi:argininosuccinate lyase
MSKHAQPVSRSGRFESGPAADVSRFTQSVSFDWRLWRHDIVGSMAHACMLQKVGLLSEKECGEILRGLEGIGREISQGKFQWSEALEDVHMNIEAVLTRRVPAGAKLHTGRSRNDQVALDLRLWLRDEMAGLDLRLRGLQEALVALAQRHIEVIIPGYTHLQRAQPVYFGHHLLAYVEMFSRDRQRLAQCQERVNVSPLGNGALAGSSLPLDREYVAELLGFVDGRGKPRVTQNSMDGVSDRDFVVEYAAAAALVAAHLSRLAEDLILWSTAEFSFIRIADAYTTGSSLMPQKKNPDVAELIRGKTGRVYGNLVGLLTLLKGLPMTYNRDLQEDKEQLFDTADTVRESVSLMAGMLGQVTVQAGPCRAAASDPNLLATDLAEYLVRQGVPFRQAHHRVGELVGLAETSGRPLDALTLEEFKKVEPRFGPDALEVFNLEKSLAARNLPGGPGPKEMQKQLNRWRKKLEGEAGLGGEPMQTIAGEIRPEWL